jgi:hypothetical protein
MDEDLSRRPTDGCSGQAAPGRVAAAKLERRGGPLSAPARDGEGQPREAGQRWRHAEEQGRRGTKEKEKKKETNRYVCNEWQVRNFVTQKQLKAGGDQLSSLYYANTAFGFVFG